MAKTKGIQKQLSMNEDDETLVEQKMNTAQFQDENKVRATPIQTERAQMAKKHIQSRESISAEGLTSSQIRTPPLYRELQRAELKS